MTQPSFSLASTGWPQFYERRWMHGSDVHYTASEGQVVIWYGPTWNSGQKIVYAGKERRTLKKSDPVGHPEQPKDDERGTEPDDQ